MVPLNGQTFDHLQDFGFLAFDESTIVKIQHVQVFTFVLGTTPIISLVTMYQLKNTTLSDKTNGIYLSNPPAVISLSSGEYITKIELCSER